MNFYALSALINGIISTGLGIFISAYAKEEIYQEALKLNAAAYIEKPFDIKALLQAVKKAIG